MANAIDLHRYNSLVRQVYAAGLDANNWRQVMAGISDIIGHVRLAMNGHDLRSNSNIGFLTHNYGSDFQASYVSHYAAINPWNARAARMPVGKAIPSQLVLEPEQLKRSEFYSDWIRPQDDVGTGAGITLFRDRGRFLRLSANIRFRDQELMQEPLVRLLDHLAPHMSAAFKLGRNLEAARFGRHYRQAVEHCTDAVFLLDYSGRVCLVSAAAEDLRKEGAYVRIDRDNRLNFIDRSAQRLLDIQIGNILADRSVAAPDIAFRCSETASPVRALVAPFVTEENVVRPPLRLLVSGYPAIIVTLTRPRREPIQGLGSLRKAYGLTAAECALANHLGAGRSLGSFAEARGVSIHTARNQLRSLMSKTGTNRQLELVSLVARTVSEEGVPQR